MYFNEACVTEKQTIGMVHFHTRVDVMEPLIVGTDEHRGKYDEFSKE